jgi:hypothetical protein
MKQQRVHLFIALTSLAISCGVDERPLVFKIGTTAFSSGSAAGDAPTGEPPAGSTAEPSGGAGAPEGGALGEGGALTSGMPTGGSGGSQQGGSSPNGGSGSENTAGSSNPASGGAGGAEGDPWPCGDMNDNHIDDCEETRLTNARFDSAITAWEAEPLLEQKWAPTNALGGNASGALSASNQKVVADGGGNIALASRQCISAWMGQSFDVGAKAFIKAGQGSGKAMLNLAIYAGDHCDGDFIEAQTIGTAYQVDAWQNIEGHVTMPPAARSMYVRLMSVKPMTQASFEVLFDDVRVSEQE